MTKPLFAFVLMPFHSDFDDVYRLGIRAAAESHGIQIERVDDQIFHNEQILERIFNQIDVADFIIADMTGKNPNVFYEVGYAHAKHKTCILLTKQAEDIPFDLKHSRHIIYGNSITKLRNDLTQDISVISGEISRSRAQRINVFVARSNGLLEKNAFRATANITISISLRNETNIRSPVIDSIYFYAKEGWEFKQDGRDCTSDKSDVKGFGGRYFLVSPIHAIPPGGFVQININGKRLIANKLKGEELKDSYKISGRAMVRIHTEKGNIDFPFTLEIECDEIPF